MPKKTALIIVIIFLIIAGIFAYWFFSVSNQEITTDNTNTNNLFPFGQNGQGNNLNGNNINNGENSTVNATSTPNETLSILRQISSVPVAGTSIIKISSGNIVRFIERGTGHIYETTTDSNAINTRISNKTIPKIYEALFANNGKDILLRYLKDDTDTIETFHAKIKTSVSTSTSGTVTLEGSFLTSNIKEVAVLEDIDKLFSLVETSTGAVGVISKTDGSGKNQIFNSFLNYWLVNWPRESTIVLTTKPASDENGFLYYLNTQTGAQTQVLGPIKGLTALVSPDTNKILYNESSGQSFLTSIYDLTKNQVRNFGTQTLPEKCVWSKGDKEIIYCAIPENVPYGSYPEDWYQGLVSFSDNIWKININTGSTNLLAKLSSLSGKEIDVINPMISSGGEYLVFQNKNDLTLWGLNIVKK